MITATPRSIANLTRLAVLGRLQPYETEWGFVDYDERLTPNQLGRLLNGNRGDLRQEAIEEIDEIAAEKASHGVQDWINNNTSDAEYDLLDDHGLLDELRGDLHERDTGDVWADLTRNTFDQAMKIRTGHEVEPGADDEGLEELAAHLVSLGAYDDQALKAAEELIAEQGHYGGELYVVWYGDVKPILDLVLGVHFENQPDIPHRFTWTGQHRGDANGHPELLLWQGMNGAGHAVTLPDGIAVTAGVDAIEADFQYYDGPWSWCDDCAGIYLPAYAATVTITEVP